jgi:hypothetical protein
MAVPRSSGKLYRLFTMSVAFLAALASRGWGRIMIGIAIALFVALFGWGATYFGWDDPEGKVQLALAASFILGVFAGYRGKS